MINREDIAVIGAGLVGCTLAKLLAAKGYSVSIFEKREKNYSHQMGNGRSTHLIISQRGAKALKRLGLLEEVLVNAIPLIGRLVHEQDASLSEVRYGVNDQEIFSIQRECLNRILINACASDPKVRIFYGSNCESIDLKRNKIYLSLSDVPTTYKLQAPQIFVCDGANSKIRSQLINTGKFNFTQSYEQYGYKELTISKDSSKNLAREYMHAWPRGSFSLFAFPNHDGSFTATLLAPLGKDGFDSIQEKSDLKKLFRKNFKDLNSDELIKEYFEKPVSFLKSSSCSPWSTNPGILLLGDAAHTMLPFLGQGMNCGLEDCTEFDDLLECNGGNFELTISTFEKHRKVHTDCVTELSRNAFQEFTVDMASKKYLYEKYIENKICELSKGRLKNSYQLLAFTCTPYCQINQKINDIKRLTQMVIEKLESRYSKLKHSEHEVIEIIKVLMEESENEYTIN